MPAVPAAPAVIDAVWRHAALRGSALAVPRPGCLPALLPAPASTPPALSQQQTATPNSVRALQRGRWHQRGPVLSRCGDTPFNNGAGALCGMPAGRSTAHMHTGCAVRQAEALHAACFCCRMHAFEGIPCRFPASWACRHVSPRPFACTACSPFLGPSTVHPAHSLTLLTLLTPHSPQYYDIPSPSLRNAVYQEMQADIAPFKVGVCIACCRC